MEIQTLSRIFKSCCFFFGDFPNCPLKKIVQSNLLTMGNCFRVEPSNPSKQLEDKELSMLQLIDFCNMHPKRGRQFVDQFLDLVAEEMRERGFDPCDKERPRRDTLTKKVMRMYGRGCNPAVVHMAIANKDRLLNLQEEPAKEKRKKKCGDRDESAMGVTEEQL
jgi:hypothetical protein